jgi:hypothetical protein
LANQIQNGHKNTVAPSSLPVEHRVLPVNKHATAIALEKRLKKWNTIGEPDGDAISPLLLEAQARLSTVAVVWTPQRWPGIRAGASNFP